MNRLRVNNITKSIVVTEEKKQTLIRMFVRGEKVTKYKICDSLVMEFVPKISFFINV